nr:hypothetical protein CFP56_26525 [Quercus suber]
MKLSLPIPTGPRRKSEISPLTLLSFLIRKELGSSLGFLLSNSWVHTPKKDKSPSYLLLDSLQANRTIKKLPPSHAHGSNTKRKKTLSSSLPLIPLKNHKLGVTSFQV